MFWPLDDYMFPDYTATGPKEQRSHNPHSITRAQFKRKKKRTKLQKLSRRKNR